MARWLQRDKRVLGRRALEILRIVVEDERVTGLEEFDEFALDAGISGGFAVLEVVHPGLRGAVVLERSRTPEWGAADGEISIRPSP